MVKGIQVGIVAWWYIHCCRMEVGTRCGTCSVTYTSPARVRGCYMHWDMLRCGDMSRAAAGEVRVVCSPICIGLLFILGCKAVIAKREEGVTRHL